MSYIKYGVIALFVGVIALIVGLAILATMIAIEGIKGDVSVGGVIIVGPVPIILGGGPYSEILTILATILAIAVVLLFLLHYFSALRSSRR